MNRNVFKPFLFVALLVLTVGLACGIDFGGTKTAEPGPPQPVIQPTPISQDQQPSPQVEPPTQAPPTVAPQSKFFTDNFDSNADNWSPFVTKGMLSQADLSVSGGYYIFDLPEAQVWTYSLYTPEVYSDVRIDVVAENRGFNNNNVSLVCRYSEKEGWYEASIANNGLYWLYYGKWDNNGKTASYALIYSGGSNDIKQGKAVNTYTLICQGRTLILGINGIQSEKVDDNKFVLREGNIGLGVSSFNTIPIRVDFDSIKISEP
jgi:hypothetical protein